MSHSNSDKGLFICLLIWSARRSTGGCSPASPVFGSISLCLLLILIFSPYFPTAQHSFFCIPALLSFLYVSRMSSLLTLLPPLLLLLSHLSDRVHTSAISSKLVPLLSTPHIPTGSKLGTCLGVQFHWLQLLWEFTFQKTEMRPFLILLILCIFLPRLLLSSLPRNGFSFCLYFCPPPFKNIFLCHYNPSRGTNKQHYEPVWGGRQMGLSS